MLLTICVQVVLLPQWSLTNQTRAAVKVPGQVPLVVVLKILSSGLGSQSSWMIGTLKSQLSPHSKFSMWSWLQLMVGGVVSTTVTTWLHSEWLPQQSVACHFLIMTVEQGLLAAAFVKVPMTTMLTFVPQQMSDAVGGSKTQVLPHSTTLLLAQVITGGVVSATVTVWLHCAWFWQQSTASHVRVMSWPHGRTGLAFVTVLTTETDRKSTRLNSSHRT